MLFYCYQQTLIYLIFLSAACAWTSGGGYVGIWLGGIPGQIWGKSRFSIGFYSSKHDGQCNTQTAVSLLTLNLALVYNDINLINFSFSVSPFGKQYTWILSLFDFIEEYQK